jgi:prepilin-type N-terminal cleavage/methylation domain-containing protein
MNERPAVLRGEDGFTLIEMVCVLAVVAMLAAILLPRVSRETSRPRLEGYAIEAAAILKADRTAAMKAGRQIATTSMRICDQFALVRPAKFCTLPTISS